MKRRLSVLRITAALCCLVPLYSCARTEAPKASGGVLDLSTWNFEAGGPVPLVGEWAFTWDAFLEPGKDEGSGTRFMWGPKGWFTNNQGPNEPYGRFGHATYRLRVLLPPGTDRIGLRIPQQHSAFRLYVDGELVARNGSVSSSQEGYRGAWKPLTATAKVGRRTADITLHVANRSMNTGGYFYPIRIGNSEQILSISQIMFGYEAAVMGGLVVIGIYFLFFLFFRRDDASSFVIALVSLLYAVRICTHGEMIFSHFISDDVEVINLIRYVSLFLLPLSIIGFFRRFFAVDRVVYSIVERSLFFLTGWFLLIIFTTPASVYVEILEYFPFLMIPAGVFSAVVAVQSVKSGQSSAWTLLFGLVMVVGTGIFDLVVASHRLWGYGQLSPLGFLVFVMCMAWGLGKRFADSLRRQRELSEELNGLLVEQRRFSGSLELRVQERTRELTETNKRLSRAVEEANRANRAKTDFLAMMSHEIRTPMNAIVGMSEILESTGLSEVQRDYLSTMRSATDNLLVIINDVLDFAKLEFDRLAIEEISMSLPALMESFSAAFLPLAQKKGLYFRCTVAESCPDRIIADSNRLRQVLGNLVSNALKFTSNGGVTVSVSAFFEDGGKPFLLFRIQDTGIGVPKDKLEAIFESFEQADRSISRRYGGTGLGLSISRRLVHLFGGRIWAESAENAGSTFFFTLPMKVSPAESVSVEASPASREATPPTRIKVLIVEDNRVNILVARALMKSLGWNVRSVDSGRAAIEALKQEVFDVVFMDLEMPDMDGIETTKRIRDGGAGDERKNVPIIAMTAHALPLYREQAFAGGMNAYLVKPVTKAAILQAASCVVPHRVRGDAANLNIESALKAFDGNLELLRGLYRVFSEDITKVLGRYREALDVKDFDTLFGLFHAVKGSARLLNESEIEALTAELESAALGKDVESCERYFPTLETRLLSIREEMELFFASDRVKEPD